MRLSISAVAGSRHVPKTNYHGLPDDLKALVWARDGYRCRWCGRTDSGVDIHHIEYRRGYQQDHLANLITLCREHHEFVHDSYAIPKQEAQTILSYLIGPDGYGKTGLSLWLNPYPGTMRPTSRRVGRMVDTDE